MAVTSIYLIVLFPKFDKTINQLMSERISSILNLEINKRNIYILFLISSSKRSVKGGTLPYISQAAKSFQE